MTSISSDFLQHNQTTNKMIVFFLCITFGSVLVSGSSLNDKVDQNPPNMFKNPGETAKIRCLHRINSYYVILWYKQLKNRQLQLLGYMSTTTENKEKGLDEDVTIEGDANEGQNCTLTINSLSVSSSAVYFCAASYISYSPAYFGKGTKLTVLDPDRPVTPPKVKILQPSQQECRNQKEKQRKKTLVCVASGFYPDHVTVSWKINDEDYSSGVATDSAAQEIEGSYRITSRFKVNAALWENQENSFMCIVSFFDGETTTNHTATLHGVQGKGGGITRGEYLKVTQSAKLSYVVVIVKSCIYGVFVGFLVWKLQGSSRKHK